MRGAGDLDGEELVADEGVRHEVALEPLPHSIPLVLGQRLGVVAVLVVANDEALVLQGVSRCEVRDEV